MVGQTGGGAGEGGEGAEDDGEGGGVEGHVEAAAEIVTEGVDCYVEDGGGRGAGGGDGGEVGWALAREAHGEGVRRGMDEGFGGERVFEEEAQCEEGDGRVGGGARRAVGVVAEIGR